MKRKMERKGKRKLHCLVQVTSFAPGFLAEPPSTDHLTHHNLSIFIMARKNKTKTNEQKMNSMNLHYCIASTTTTTLFCGTQKTQTGKLSACV